MFETTNLLPIRYLQDKDNAKVFLEALLGKSISGIERFYWRTNLPEAFDLRQGKPDIYLEDQNKNQYAILERRYGFECGYQDTVSRFIQNAMSADSLSYHGTVSECSESYIIFLSHLGCFGQSDAICDLSDVSTGGDSNNRCHKLSINTHYLVPNADPQVIKILDILRSEDTEIMRKENLVEMWVTAPNEKDRDAFMSEWALTESWGLDDTTDGDELTERAMRCAYVWDVSRMGIKEIRESIGLTQIEFSHRLCIPMSTIQAWENGEDCAGYIRYMAALLLGVLKEVK